MRQLKLKSLYYNNSYVFGIPALFYILIGGRGLGKTFSTMNYCLKKFFKKGEKFLWLRLTEASVQKLLANNAKDFIDSKLIEKYNITEIKTEGNAVIINGKEACRIMAISTFYTMKGVALNKTTGKKKKNENLDPDSEVAKLIVKNNVKKFKNIVMDEMNREKNEKRTFDICYAFVNQIENICRLDTDRRIILTGNTLEEASDIMVGCFNFIPDKFGVYRLHNKKAVVHYIEDSDEYRAKRQKSIAGILTPNESTFTNMIETDIDLLHHGRLPQPSAIIKFDNNNYYTVCGTVITKMKQPKHSTLPTTAMKPYIPGLPYYKERANQIIEFAQQRLFDFDKLYTLKLFYKDIKLLKEK